MMKVEVVPALYILLSATSDAGDCDQTHILSYEQIQKSILSAVWLCKNPAGLSHPDQSSTWFLP